MPNLTLGPPRMATQMTNDLYVFSVTTNEARRTVKREHYLHRVPPISFAFGLFDAELLGHLVGVVTFGVPASRHVMISACRSKPDSVLELNRLWVDDVMPRNTETWFLARALALMPPRVIVSYADTSVGHNGYVYRAANFRYAGVTDIDRKTPRCDYVTIGKHSRDTSRNGTMKTAARVRRKPKHRYWTTTGDRRERRLLARLVTWPSLQWGSYDV